MKKKYWWIIGIAAVVLIAIFILVLTENILPIDPKSELMQKMSTVLQTYSINSISHGESAAQIVDLNSSFSIKNGIVSQEGYYKIEYPFGISTCEKEEKDGNWIYCFCNSSDDRVNNGTNIITNCLNDTSCIDFCNLDTNPDASVKKILLEGLKQLGDYKVDKFYVDDGGTCYLAYDNDTTNCKNDYIYCFNEEGLLANGIMLYNDTDIGYNGFSKGYSESDIFKKVNNTGIIDLACKNYFKS